MKVIDLLNKIANGEEVPKKFRYELFELLRTKSNDIRKYYVDKEGIFFFEQYSYDLNDEIEEIEEGIRKLPNEVQEPHNFEEVVYIAEDLARKINEIIDKLNEGE